MMLALLGCSLATGLSATASDTLQQEIQAFIDSVATESGFSFSVGYVDENTSFGLGAGPRSPKGYNVSLPGNVRGEDTMLLGSGTKPFTAAAIMRLVEAGEVSLSDAASTHVDVALERIGDSRAKSLVGLYGAKAARVTIGQLMGMQSGIGDFDVASYDDALLKAGSSYHSILEPLLAVAAFTAPDGCDPWGPSAKPCTFVCNPGECTSYSSTNYILLGLVLLAHAPPEKQDVGSFDQLAAVGLDRRTTTLRTPTRGALNATLSTVGASEYFGGKTAVWGQDASVLGWTCGNVIGSAQAVAAFYYELLGPPRSIVNATSLQAMATMSTITRGWEEGELSYGYGLMIQNVGAKQRKTPSLSLPGSYIGHAGDTYAFISDNGWYPALNASISVIVNEDSDFRYPSFIVTCKIVELVYKARGLPVELGCLPPTKQKYRCWHGHKQCYPTSFGGSDQDTCEAACK